MYRTKYDKYLVHIIHMEDFIMYRDWYCLFYNY